MARPTRRPGEASPQGLYQLGVQGRKTGAKLKDDAASTEEPVTAATPSPPPGDDDASVPMEIAQSGGPGPATVLRENRNLKFPLPKGRSPGKTNARLLRSPAIRHPSISPMRQSPADSTARHVGFSSPSQRGHGRGRPSSIAEIPSDDSITAMVGLSNKLVDATPNRVDYRTANEYIPRPRPPQPTMGMSDKALGKQRAEPRRSPSQPLLTEPSPPRVASPQFPGEPSIYVDPEPEPEPEPEPDSEPQRHSSSPESQAREPPVSIPSPRPPTYKRPTPAASTTSATRRRAHDDEDDGRNSAKRHRQTESVVSRRSEQPAKRGPGRPPKNGVAKRGRGRPRRSEIESDGEEGESLMTLQRGPPMPKSRGLVSMRRDAASAIEHRGRVNGADWWADLQTDSAAYEYELPGGQRLPPQATTRQRRRPAAAMADEEEELEDWEVDPGSITGEIVLWEPEHEHNPPGPDDPVQVTDECIAITAEAIQTFAIRDSDARYAKPLTMPFMGAGLVDLPPGSEKRPKNSRKMHLVFFVHYGKVTVSINEEQFRISAGGMWFVPRGNYYNIANEFDFPARVYFAQACEVSPSPQAVDDMTQTIVA
ncbi:cupin domain-containing protein [Cordyceps javanica]|uniref:CENP-C homolog n=1 Tax=Cordyceps javanica TaxID=43265 RepID=A0A545WCU3_9HYPO|nr:cupin domain-containing protein [Cordyceps javanica]TQW11752.1 cupin domain-containing protein [Cordyceps javanica]